MLGQFRSGKAMLGQVTSGKVWIGHVNRLGQVMSA